MKGFCHTINGTSDSTSINASAILNTRRTRGTCKKRANTEPKIDQIERQMNPIRSNKAAINST